MSKNKPSLYREDYYAPEEYGILHRLLYNSKNLVEVIIHVHTRKDNIKGIKRSILTLNRIKAACFDGTKYPGIEIHDLMYNTHIDDIALSLNKSPVHTTICQWRFQINK
jgi:hypothetical protein